MKHLTLLLFFFLPFTLAAQDTLMQTHDFGVYKVRAGFCGDVSSVIEIIKDGNNIYRSCGGDGYYAQIDTIHLNNDNQIDFIFSYNMEEYFSMGCLVSNNQSSYDNIDLGGEYFEPTIPDSIYADGYELNDFSIDKKNINIFNLYNPNTNLYLFIGGAIPYEFISLQKIKKVVRKKQKQLSTSP